MLKRRSLLPLFILILIVLVLGGCISPKDKVERARLLKTEEASTPQLMNEINRFARVGSMRAKMDLKFEDNSFAEVGVAEKYKTADGEVVVQRPANILLKVQIPIIKTDVAQMTSNGSRFCVAILEDGSGGKYKKFVCGTNDADYSLLQEQVKNADFNGNGKEIKQSVNAFSNLRPQHFTEAMLVRPVDTQNYSYSVSSTFQEEFDLSANKKSPTRWVLRGYYLLDEFRSTGQGELKISRRFWFDRVGKIRLARQQIFDDRGEIESDIVYGKEGNLGTAEEYRNLPLEIAVMRPKEKYKMRLTYQSPGSVSIGRSYNQEVFELKNVWGLEEIDLDKKLEEARGQRPVGDIPKTATRLQ